ncbi:MAG: Major Facilitator Superfamily protein [Candidatus Izimaplasma bacterium HR2]|nr:MAG: Major Facilitator Superfamily protein [Candidatus Izimaplasma bacterium HR2]
MKFTKSTKFIYFAFIWHGFFLALTVSMLDLNTVFPALITTLTESRIIFGALYSVMLGVPLIFNVIFSHYLRNKEYKKKYLLLGIYLRSSAFLGMAIFTYYFSENNPMLTLGSFFFFVFLFSVSAGFAGLSYSDIIAKSLSSEKRVNLYTVKQFFGSTSAFAGGLLIARIFSIGIDYPLNYTISLLIGSLGLVIASLGFILLPEPKSLISNNTEPLGTFIKKIPSILKKDNSFKLFIIVENLAGFSIMILPFYMLYAKERFNIDDSYIGTYLIWLTVGTIFSNLVWGFLASRFNAKQIVRFCILLGGLNPLLAIYLGTISPDMFAIVFFILGFMISGRKIGFEPYLLDIIPTQERVEYLGIRGSLNILIIILPLVGAVIINLFGFNITFIIVSIMMGLAVLLLSKISNKQIQELC